MDKLIEKFGIFDILAVLVPGMTFTIFAVLWIVKMELLEGTICENLIQEIIRIKMKGIIYILFICFSYVMGMVWDAFRRIIFTIPFFDRRTKYPSKADPLMKRIYIKVFESIYKDMANESITEEVLNSRTKESQKRNREICNYCMTALEVYGGINKSERMLVISEMNGSLCIVFGIFSILFAYANKRMGSGFWSWSYIVALIIITVFLGYNYFKFSKYRIDSIFQSYYLKFIKVPQDYIGRRDGDSGACP